MKRQPFFILLFAMISCFAGTEKTLIISKTTLAPKIDGIIDDNDPWSVTWITMTQNSGANSTSDVTGKFQIAFDENNLYLAVVSMGDKSLDTSSAKTPNSWENDCIEVYVLLDTAAIEINDILSKFNPGDYHFIMRKASVFPDRFDPNQMTCDWLHSDFKIGQTNSDSSYTQEWRMPWAVLADSSGMNPAWDKKWFKFEIMISDNTGVNGRTQRLFWNSDFSSAWINYVDPGLVGMLLNKISNNINNELVIYPNPTNDKLTIGSQIPEQSDIDILNIEGKQVISAKLNACKSVDGIMLRAGVYMVKIIDREKTYSGKFIKR
jgi:hypothetical protein